ncbi:MAG: Mur ligase family protein [bacterium]|nr:Mur ligase family protein [bacterium]
MVIFTLLHYYLCIPMISLRGKKVLVMGLGLLGGGVATTKWLVKQGARVTVTDLKTRKELLPSIKALGLAAKKVRFVLGRHDEEDFRAHDYIVVNPGVPKESPYLKIAKRAHIRIINDAVLFFEYLPKENPIIAVTGTRGKTTTTNWIAHLLRARWPNVRAAGNTPENPLLKELERIVALPEWIPDQVRNDNGDKYHTPVVLELSSWQLEYLPEAKRAPDIAVITNLYPDHLNRYTSIKEYAGAKANIFKNQTKKQALILNKDNEWTKWFLAQKPKSRVHYISSSLISKYRDMEILRCRDINMGEHNVQNLRAASLTAHLLGISWKDIHARVSSLPAIRFRQEIVYEKNGLLIINDSASTSPEAGIAALRRFSKLAAQKKQPLFFIAGGTDKGLSYKGWAEEVGMTQSTLASEGLDFQLFLLEGSATEKIEKALEEYREEYPSPAVVGSGSSQNHTRFARSFVGDVEMSISQDLEAIMKDVKKKVDEKGGGVVVFSPSAASFLKFKNEFDRGERFNQLAQKYFVGK